MKKRTYIRTKNHKKLMSKILTGRIFSIRHKKKISENHADVGGNKNPNWKGGVSKILRKCENCSKKFFIQQSKIKFNRGKYCSRMCRNMKQGERILGKNHWNWQGGKTNIMERIRALSKYKKWRNGVYIRDKYLCVICKKNHDFNADHIVPLSILIRKNNISTLEQAIECQDLWNINNGRTLCEYCHSQTDTYLNSSMVKDYGKFRFN